MGFREIRPKGPRYGYVSHPVRISRSKKARETGLGEIYLVFSEELLRKMDWPIGTRIIVCVGLGRDHGVIRIQADPAGYVISAAYQLSKAANRKTRAGAKLFYRGKVGVSDPDLMSQIPTYGPLELDEYEVKDGALIIELDQPEVEEEE